MSYSPNPFQIYVVNYFADDFLLQIDIFVRLSNAKVSLFVRFSN